MFIWKKVLPFLLIVPLLLASFLSPASATEKEHTNPLPSPSVSAQSAILIEAESGDAVYGKDCDLPLPMASTTKIMTALVALEKGAPDQKITVDPSAVGVEGSSVYLSEGEVLTLEQLLYALLLESANDAAVAIAVGISGSVEAFAAEMNLMAQSLGLKNTHFQNPHGLDDEEHYTTARELATITRRAMEHSLFCDIVSTRKATIPHADNSNVRLLVNHNKLLRSYEGCIGVKTGFTKRSGRCLVSAAKRDGVTLIAVTLNAPSDWSDHAALLDYGFSKYESVLLCDAEEYLFPLPVVGGVEEYVMVGTAEPLRITLPREHGAILSTVEIDRFLYAPVLGRGTVGRVIFRCDRNGDGNVEVLAEVPLTAYYTVERQPAKKNLWQWLLSLLGF